MAFCDLTQNIACAEAYLKFCIGRVLEASSEDIALLDRFYAKGLIERHKVIRAA